MSKILVVLLSFFVIVAIPVVASAQETDSTTPTRPNAVRSNVANTAMEAKDAMQDKISDARMEFKEKIQSVKDTTKQQVLEKIVERINENNQTKTMKMSERLDRLTMVLANISEMAATLADQEVDVTRLNNLISSANTAIDKAKASVEEQMEKEYLVNITTDSALRTNARSTIQGYISDIKAVFQDVVEAHRAVVQAHTTAKALTTDTVEDTSDEVVE